jgi:hypothetical protein
MRDRLPQAPLIEVVFELRWQLVGTSGIPLQLHSDPGLFPLLHEFAKQADKLGFNMRQDMSPPEQTVGYAIVHRYRSKESPEFPLLQVGPGIFAANQGPLYQWSEFKELVSKGLKALLTSYPRLPAFPLNPVHIELRYLDIFDRSLLGTTDMVDFVNRGTTMPIEAPPFLQQGRYFDGEFTGRLAFQRAAKAWKGSEFSMEFGAVTLTAKAERAFRLETKVVTSTEAVPKLAKDHTQFLSAVAKWLEFAHGLTSPFFKEFVKHELMAHFEAERDE